MPRDDLASESDKLVQSMQCVSLLGSRLAVLPRSLACLVLCAPGFFTVFSRTVPLELSSMIWDHFMLDGDIFLFRAVRDISHQLTSYHVVSSSSSCCQR
eukprot:COSAG06_NODE_1591_length_8997_cov_166.390874_11_plen_99_part_00